MADFLKVELKTSAICRTKRQKDTLRGLGLRHINQVRILKNTPPIRGMVQKVIHLVHFEETQSKELPKKEKTESYKLGAKGGKAPKATVKAKATPKNAPVENKAEPKQAAKSSEKAAASKKAPAKKDAPKTKAKKES